MNRSLKSKKAASERKIRAFKKKLAVLKKAESKAAKTARASSDRYEKTSKKLSAKWEAIADKYRVEQGKLDEIERLAKACG